MSNVWRVLKREDMHPKPNFVLWVTLFLGQARQKRSPYIWFNSTEKQIIISFEFNLAEQEQ